jgi:hypothetical protein
LKYLEINNCKIKPTLLQDFTNELKHNRDIQNLTISALNFDEVWIRNISEFVLKNFNLRKLNMSWNVLKSSNMLEFMNNLKGIKHLQYLNVSANPFEGPKSLDLTRAMWDHIVLNSSLIHLDMSACNLDPNEIEILLGGIKMSKSLLAVHFSGNGMSDSTKKLILETLTKSEVVRLLTSTLLKIQNTGTSQDTMIGESKKK